MYDASAKEEGLFLNQKIFDLLLRFRVHKIALTADVEKAFLMISITGMYCVSSG